MHMTAKDWSEKWLFLQSGERKRKKKKGVRFQCGREQLKQCLDTRGKGPPTSESLWCHKEVPQANNNSAVQCKTRLSRMNDVWQMWARLSWSCLTFVKHRAIQLRWAGARSRRETVPALPALHKPPINLSSRSRLGLTKQAGWSKAALQAPVEDEYVYACILCAAHARIATLSNTNSDWFH